jgi:hypothetical protein
VPFYYIINYRAYEPDTQVKTFSMADYEAAGEVVKQTAKALDQNTKVPGVRELGRTARERIEPGKELSMTGEDGPAAGRLITVQISPKDAPQVLRSAVLEATFDGETTVWCPLGEFFGCGARLDEVQDWFRTVEKDGKMTCRWVMPNQKSARIAIKNLGQQAFEATLQFSTGPWQWDDRSMHFHANWRHEHPINTRPMSDWNYIEIQGQGVYVGDTLTVFSPVPQWYGEGDERVYIDGEKSPSHLGTGTEDYYGYAWGMAHRFDSPFISMPKRSSRGRNDWRGYTTTSRVRLLDSIPMRKSLRFDMEIWNWADTKVGYAAGKFWYARPGATSNRGPSPDEAAQELIPWPPVK